VKEVVCTGMVRRHSDGGDFCFEMQIVMLIVVSRDVCNNIEFVFFCML
jgi:hypothetical protein